MAHTSKELALELYKQEIVQDKDVLQVIAEYKDYGVLVESTELIAFKGEEAIDHLTRFYKKGKVYKMNPKTRKMSVEVGTYKEIE